MGWIDYIARKPGGTAVIGKELTFVPVRSSIIDISK